MIQEIFLRRAANIRKNYLHITTDISSYEKAMTHIIKVIEEKHKELIDIKNKIDESKIHSADTAKTELLRVMMELEEESNSVESYINSLTEKMDVLKKEELDLFRDIRQRYPELSDTQIKSEVQDYIKKLNLS